MFNLFTIFWLIVTFSVLILGLITNNFSDLMPKNVVNLVKFGKLLDKSDLSFGSSVVKWLQIPKRWFRHFYIFAVIYYTILLFLLTTTNFFATGDHSLWNQLKARTLEIVIGRKLDIKLNQLMSESNLLLIISLSIQMIRRLYETQKISVFSHSTINVIHYLSGIAFYVSTGLAMLHTIDSIGPEHTHNPTVTRLSFLLFLISSLIQFKCNLILSDLRRHERNGQTVMTYDYQIPNGSLFELVSCPHYLMEIVIYFSVYLMSQKNILWFILLNWVIVNQIMAALLTHNWYLKTFGKEYPKTRRAIIPLFL